MKEKTFRQAPWLIVVHWLIALALLGGAIGIYFYVFYIPFKSISLEACPLSCRTSDDCRVEDCPEQVECDLKSKKCTIASNHGHFVSAASIFGLGLIGLAWLFIALYITRQQLQIREDGIHYRRLTGNLYIPWDQFLGITFHGVNTRFGTEATIYSIAGDSGIFSFLVKGLPEGTSTREIALGSMFLLHVSKSDADELFQTVEEKAEMKPEPEYEY